MHEELLVGRQGAFAFAIVDAESMNSIVMYESKNRESMQVKPRYLCVGARCGPRARVLIGMSGMGGIRRIGRG